MQKNHFKDNRLKIQKSFIDRNFLIPLTKNDLPVIIEEHKAKGHGKLRKVVIENIPVTDDIRPISYLLELEMEGELFSCPPGYKIVEKAILLFCRNSLYIVLLEMKSSLNPAAIRQVEEKIKDSIGRILLFLTHYILDVPAFNDYKINFFTLVLYNADHLTRELQLNSDPSLYSLDLIKIFEGKQSSCFVTEPLGGSYKVEVIFKKNAGTEDFEIDLNDVFNSNNEYNNAIYSEKTFP
jgi:hypothetical protein